jgi:biotin operon repressor
LTSSVKCFILGEKHTFWRRKMPYERSRRIEQRFGRVVGLIQEGRSTSADLSAALDVSRGTVHRIIAELRRRGFTIRSVREENGWIYEITEFPKKKDYGVSL